MSRFSLLMSAKVLITSIALIAQAGVAIGDDPVRWIAVGGGADPASTQVSLEQDIGLARKVLGGGGQVLFGGGGGVYGVQVLGTGAKDGSLLRELGEIMDPRDGRDADYRLPSIEVDGAATREGVLAALSDALRQPAAPLLVYVATHGEDGETPADNSIQLWGGEGLSVAQLAETLDASTVTRSARLVVSACFSGGFADLVFTGSDPDKGQAAKSRCGLFASQADEESSGCDPNPDRRRQEGYGLHFLHALRGEDRDGRQLPRRDVDFDGDGKITLLEAHTRARIASISFGSPTTTAERWLRHAAGAEDTAEVTSVSDESPDEPVAFPEEEAVIRALTAELSVSDEKEAESRLASLDAELRAAAERAEEREREESRTFARLRIVLLERWPVLDDPWRPDFHTTLTNEAAAVRRVLAASPAARSYGQARDRMNQTWERMDTLRVGAGRLRRLVRAYETRRLAGRLRLAGGEAWETYKRFLSCERTAP